MRIIDEARTQRAPCKPASKTISLLNPNPATDLKDTDRCVMCGLCLPHCPTYLKTRDEAESPRGRIALMQGLASGQLTLNARLESHLDHCLACRACEKACPSQVPYGRLIDSARAVIETQRNRPWPTRMWRQLGLQGLLPHPGRLRLIARLLRIYQITGLRRLLNKSGLLNLMGMAALDARLPLVPPMRSLPAYTPAQGTHRGDVALFIGCVAASLDQATHTAAITLLTRLGFGVHVPRAQTCCGAMHRHLGEPHAADQLLERNAAAFADLDIRALISTSSACGTHLIEHGAHLAPVRDIHDFITEQTWPAQLTVHPLQATVAVHEACTHRNGPQPIAAVYTLLQRIPGLNVVSLPGNAQCCGAAGSYMLTEPGMANALREDKLAGITDVRPDLLVSTNIGCALHLSAGLRGMHPAPEVLHPVQLLARQLTTLD